MLAIHACHPCCPKHGMLCCEARAEWLLRGRGGRAYKEWHQGHSHGLISVKCVTNPCACAKTNPASQPAAMLPHTLAAPTDHCLEAPPGPAGV